MTLLQLCRIGQEPCQLARAAHNKGPFSAANRTQQLNDERGVGSSQDRSRGRALDDHAAVNLWISAECLFLTQHVENEGCRAGNRRTKPERLGQAGFVAPHQLLHRIDRTLPLVDLLIPVPHIHDLTGLSLQQSQHHLVGILDFIQQDILRIELNVSASLSGER